MKNGTFAAWFSVVDAAVTRSRPLCDKPWPQQLEFSAGGVDIRPVPIVSCQIPLERYHGGKKNVCIAAGAIAEPVHGEGCFYESVVILSAAFL
jgi:hypothetical protein